MRHTIRLLALSLVFVLATGAVLYAFFGLRLVVDSDGFHLRFVKTGGQLAEEIARHREAQREEAAPPATPVTPAAVPAESAGPTGADPAGSATERPASYWTEFRGPNRAGVYDERPIFTSWPGNGLEPMWKQPAGGGYASFVIANGAAFTIEQRGPQEVVAAYDVATGRELWTHGWDARFSEIMGGPGPRATPAYAAGRVFALGATGELRGLDAATGELVWRTNILEEHGASNLEWGMAASPLVVDDTVVVLPGGPNGHSVAAYDRRTGGVAWTALDDPQAYAAPMLVTLGGIRQIVVLSARRLMGLTPDGQRVLWEYPWTTFSDINAAQPVVIGDNRVFVSSAYGVGGAVVELTPSDDGFSVREVWRNIRMKNQHSGSVYHDGYLYGLDEAILACVDAATGELKWKGGRYGYGQVVLASGHLIVLAENGDLALVRATPERHHEIARFPAIEGKTWNYPALTDGVLLVRNLQEMAAFDLRPR